MERLNNGSIRQLSYARGILMMQKRKRLTKDSYISNLSTDLLRNMNFKIKPGAYTVDFQYGLLVSASMTDRSKH